MKKWDERFLEMAELVSTWSPYPRTKVGAVIADPVNRVVSLGYNGLSHKTDDNDRFEDRELSLDTIIHAEINAILFAKKDLTGHTLYTYPFMPCSKCCHPIIQTGIIRVVSFETDAELWKDSFEQSMKDFIDANVEVVLYEKF